MNEVCLIDKVCVPCRGGVAPLNDKEINTFLTQLEKDWLINEIGHLYRKYIFSNFMEAMDFANKIADLAEKEAHHPDLTVSYGMCKVEIWTHKIKGLTESDFILAAKIEIIAGSKKI
ncbi:MULTISPECIES: 4a-hydroxytetrahydrobiopterin dehydratase [unclassified Rickettsia]|uniref:4a-hydroxytetrahydrobiopterin dehydratase n=1 Tax=unclassified Rickettsia TaxID=114295 RepID=UPI003132FF86